MRGHRSDPSPGGWWAFTQGTNQQWTLAFDTTILNDGVYTFTLSYIIDIPDGGGDDGVADVSMRTFGFVLDGDEIEIYIPDNLITGCEIDYQTLNESGDRL